MPRAGRAATPQLALDMHAEAITLFARRGDGAGWRELVSVPLDSDDLAAELDELRVAALVHGGKATSVMLWLPPDQILVRRAKLRETSPLRRADEARASLAGDTIYGVSELAIAVSPVDSDGWTTILATLNSTVEEAREYAARWGLKSGPVSTRSEADAFSDGPAVFEAPVGIGRRIARHGARVGLGLGTAAALSAAVWAGVTFLPVLMLGEPTDLRSTAPGAPVSTTLAGLPVFGAPDSVPARAEVRSDPPAPGAPGQAPSLIVTEPPELVLAYYRPSVPAGGLRRTDAFSIGAAPAVPAHAGAALAAAEPAVNGAAPVPAPLSAPLPVVPESAPPEDPGLLAGAPEPEGAAGIPGVDDVEELEAATAYAPEGAPQPPARPTALADAEPEAAPDADPVDGTAASTTAAALAVPVPVPAPDREPAPADDEDATVVTADIPAPAAPAPAASGASTAAGAIQPVFTPDRDAATRFAVLIAPSPPARPTDLVVGMARESVPAAIPDLGSNRGIVPTGTRRVALDMNAASLVGIINSDTGRRALVRLPGGEFKRLSRGDRLDGWQVSMIGVDALRLTQGSQEITLLLISR